MNKIKCDAYYNYQTIDLFVPYEIAIWLTTKGDGNLRQKCKKELRKYNKEMSKDEFEEYFENMYFEIAEEGTNFIRPLQYEGFKKWEILGIRVGGLHQLIPTFNHVCGGYTFNGEQECVVMRFYGVSKTNGK